MSFQRLLNLFFSAVSDTQAIIGAFPVLFAFADRACLKRFATFLRNWPGRPVAIGSKKAILVFNTMAQP
jgi:hypothetical protein